MTDSIYAPHTAVQWSAADREEMKANAEAHQREVDARAEALRIKQQEATQGTSSGPSTGALLYTAPASSLAGSNSTTESLNGAGNQGNTPAAGIVGDGPGAINSPGVGAPTDDNSNGPNTFSGTNSILNSSTQPAASIKPRANVLDNFASYTYNISWYLLTAPQANVVMTSSKVDTSQWSLLVQSGGAPASQQAVSQTGFAGVQLPGLQQAAASTIGGTMFNSTPGRNQFFPLDYYIDNLEIDAVVAGQAQGTINGLRFQVTEPNGLTLLPNLNNAVRTAYKDTNSTPRSAHYCLVIKFYGWDINGNLITDPTKNQGLFGLLPSNSNAAVTRYYPFQIKTFEFKLANKVVEYSIEGFPTHFKYASSTAFGSIPYNIELSGTTVNEVLVGNGTTNVVPLDSKGKPIDGREAASTSEPSVASSPVVKTDNSEQASASASTPTAPAGITDQGYP